MDKVWIVRGSSSNGEKYSDYSDTDWTVVAYTTKEMADYHCELLNKRAKELALERRVCAEKQAIMAAELDPDCTWDNGNDTNYHVIETILALHPDDFKEKAGIQ